MNCLDAPEFPASRLSRKCSLRHTTDYSTYTQSPHSRSCSLSLLLNSSRFGSRRISRYPVVLPLIYIPARSLISANEGTQEKSEGRKFSGEFRRMKNSLLLLATLALPALGLTLHQRDNPSVVTLDIARKDVADPVARDRMRRKRDKTVNQNLDNEVR